MNPRLAAAAPVLLQSGLDAGYDVYAFGRDGDIKKGVAASAGGLGVGLAGAYGLHKMLPAKYKLAGAMLGNFAGSVLGAELGMGALNKFRTASNYQAVNEQPPKSVALQSEPVLTQIKKFNYE